jgi:photosystem II S4 domain protein
LFNREQLLEPFVGEDREIAARILDLAELAYKHNRPEHGDFLDPHGQKVALEVVRWLKGFIFRLNGGYKAAERKRLSLLPDYFFADDVDSPIVALQIEGDFRFTKAAHRDVLGSLMGLGLRREKVGDILPSQQGWQVLLAAEIAGFVEQNLTTIRGIPVEVKPIELEQLAVEPEEVKPIRATVASLRLDAVAAAGYGVSRSKMAVEIKGQKVRLNWQPVSNPALPIKKGDVLSIRGRGRVVVEDILGTTKKGRQHILLVRYR